MFYMRILIPCVILVSSAYLGFWIIENQSKDKKRKQPQTTLLNVKVMEIRERSYEIKIKSYGIIQPQIKSILIVQISGQIISISPNLSTGGVFRKGEELLRIDERNHQANLRIAKASFIKSNQYLIEEKARSIQAARNWERLGNKGNAPDLVLHKPQLSTAKAELESSRSNFIKAQLNLARTRIIAPYSGRVLRAMVHIGQVVFPNTKLADIYSLDKFEVRLPIDNYHSNFINLPTMNLTKEHQNENYPKVWLYSDLGEAHNWHGKIIRTEGIIEEHSRQLHVIAQIKNIYNNRKSNKLNLTIGQYVHAEIEGKTIINAVIIPNDTIYQGKYVYIINNNNILIRRKIKIDWQNDEDTLIFSGLYIGEKLVLTPIGQISSGVQVNISELRTTEHLKIAQ